MDGADGSAARPGKPGSLPVPSDDGCTTEPLAAGSLAAKIDRLLRTTRPPGSTAEYTYDQVAAAIAERGGPTISASYLYLLRRGLRDNPTKRHLEALAGFFAVPASYFVDTHDPAEEERLGLLSALRDPRVHTLAVTAAALPDAELDVVAQLVALAADLDGLRGAARRRAPGDPAGTAGASYAAGAAAAAALDHDRAAELELAYARVSLQNGQADEALRHLSTIEELRGVSRALRDEGDRLTALAHEALGRPDRALTILLDKLAHCLDGTCELPLARIGEQICQLALAGGDRLLALDAGRRTLAGLEERGLGGTEDHLHLATTVLELQVDLGQLLHAAALARRILSQVDQLGDPQQQAAVYLRCAHAAEADGRLGEAILLSNRALALTTTPDDVAGGPPLEVPRLRLAAASCLLRSVRPAVEAPGAEPAGTAGAGRFPGAATSAETAGATTAAETAAETTAAETAAETAETVAAAVTALEASRAEIGDHGTAEDRGRWAGQRAVADLVLGEPVAAEVNARRALAQLTGLARPATVEAHLVLGDALRAQGRHAHADAAHEQAARVLSGLAPERWRPWSAGVWRSLGDRWLGRGCCDRAADAYRRALDAAHLLATRPEPGAVTRRPHEATPTG